MDTLEAYAEERLAPRRPGLLSRVPALGLAVSLGVLIALLIIPTTRWIVSSQAGLQLRGPRNLSATLQDMGVREVAMEVPREDPLVKTALAERYGPNDFELQLAAAVASYQAAYPRPEGLQAPAFYPSAGDEIRKLEPRFPGNASLYANAIRMDSQNRIAIRRPREDNILAGSSPSARPASAPAQPTPAAPPALVERFLRDCEAGAKLEPGNAYFPTMRAAGLFSLSRDDEALAELHKAAGLKRWEPHYSDETNGAWRLNVMATGDRSAIHRMAALSRTLFPEVALMRQTARVALAKAIEAELAGRRDEGLRIRMDVARCGALMRAESPSVIGNLTGIAITRMVISRPGGALPLNAKGQPLRPGMNFSTPRATPAQNFNRYISYLRSIGANREADWYTAESLLAQQTQGAGLSGLNNSPAGVGAIQRLILLWLSDMVLFGNAFWLMVLGIVGALYLRRWKARQAAGWVREDAFVLLMGAACLLIGVALLGWNQGQSAYAFAQTASTMGNLSNGGRGPQISDPGALRVAAVCVLLVLPVLLGVLAMIVAAVRRRPILFEIARAFRAVGLTTAALLMIGYAVLVSQTARREAEMNEALTGILQHEGRFTAKSVGVTWPGLQKE